MSWNSQANHPLDRSHEARLRWIQAVMTQGEIMEKSVKTIIQYIYRAVDGKLDEKGYKYYYGVFSRDTNLVCDVTVFKPEGGIDYTLRCEYDGDNKPKEWFCHEPDGSLRYRLEFLRNANKRPAANVYHRADGSVFLNFKIMDGAFRVTYYYPDGTVESDRTFDYDVENDVIEFIDDEKLVIKVVKYRATKFDEQGRECEMECETDRWVIKRDPGLSEVIVYKSNGELDYVKKIVREYF